MGTGPIVTVRRFGTIRAPPTYQRLGPEGGGDDVATGMGWLEFSDWALRGGIRAPQPIPDPQEE